MKRFSISILLLLMAILTFAQKVTDAEIAAIRATYSAAKEQVELNELAKDQNVPRNDLEVISHYVIPGCGPTEEVIRYYFTLNEEPEEGANLYQLFFITRIYNVAARKFYQEFLFDGQEARLLFFFQSNDSFEGSTDETRYYYTNHGTRQSVKGHATMDEIFAARLADELKSAFNSLINRDF